VAVVALAGKSFPGHVKNIGGTGRAPPGTAHFECRIVLDQASPELRPGMTSNLVITVESSIMSPGFLPRRSSKAMAVPLCT